MDNKKILTYIDHTQLKAFCTYSDIKTLCEQAIDKNTASVCIPPSFISRVRRDFEGLNICTVVGFPLGYNAQETKVFETIKAIADGADEIDMVINIGDAKSGNFDKITTEIAALKAECGDKILKVIIEACYLDDAEKIALCKCVTDAGANYIKTSTGFGTGGATIEDINLFKANIGEGIKMKAAGGVKTKDDLVMFIEAGCDRIGTSSAIKILEGEQTSGY